MAFQLAEVLSARCGKGGRTVARIAGSRARAPGRHDPACKSGSPPLLRPPLPYRRALALPGGGIFLAQSARNRIAEGPRPLGCWAYAGAVYAQDSGRLPSAWDWAAQCLALTPPTLFDGHIGTAREGNPVVTPPPPQDDLESAPSPLPTCPKPRPFFRMELRTVVAALQLNVASRKPRPIRPRLDLSAGPPNVEADPKLFNQLRGPQTNRPHLKLVRMRHSSGHRANPAPRRPILLAKLPPDRERMGGPPAYVANSAFLPLFARPAVLLAAAPRRVPRTGKSVGNGRREKWGNSNFPSVFRASLSPLA